MSQSIPYIDPKFNINNSKAFLDSFSSNSSYYYMFAGKTSKSSSNDSFPDPIYDDFNSELLAYKDMLFGKRISNTDVNLMINRYDWTANTIYAKYDDNDPDLLSKQFYVSVQEGNTRYVYKCLNNNQNSPSTQQPTFSDTSAADIYYSTADGYQWKYMFTISEGDFNKFATLSYLPVTPDANVSANAISGALDVIQVQSGGSGYNNYLSGTFNSSDIKIGGIDTIYNISNSAISTNGFYTDSMITIVDGTGLGQFRNILNYRVIGIQKLITIDTPFAISLDATSQYEISPKIKITGDGSQTANAVARGIVNAVSNTISAVEILSRGRNYYYATAEVVYNPIVGITSNAIVSPIIGPFEGHGYDVAEELNSRYVGISTSFSNTELGTIIANNDYRQVGVLKNPLYSNVQLTIYDSDGNAGSNGAFSINETIVQSNNFATGIIKNIEGNVLTLANVYSGFVTGNNSFGKITGATSNATAVVNAISVNGVVKNFATFDQSFRYVGSEISGSFQNDELVYVTNTSFANAILYDVESNAGTYTLRTSEQYGSFLVGDAIVGNTSLATLIVGSKYYPDIVFGSGDILYLQNFSPITRDDSSSEQIKLILEF